MGHDGPGAAGDGHASLRRRLTLHAHRALLVTTRGPLRRVWLAAYALAERTVSGRLTRGEPGASLLPRATAGRAELVPGVSDIDLAIAAPDEEAAERIRGRWRRLAHRFPPVRLLVDPPVVLEAGELAALRDGTPFTIGLDSHDGIPAYLPAAARFDRVRTLERARPGRPSGAPDRHGADLVDAWLEVVWLWRLACRASVDHALPHSALLCVKLVSEPLRLLLTLEHGLRPETRADTLRAAAERWPDEHESIERALRLLGRLDRAPAPPFAEALATLVRLSARVASLLDAAADRLGGVPVLIAGASDAPQVPLCDWRELVVADGPVPSQSASAADPADVAALRTATLAQRQGVHLRLEVGPLAVLPTHDWASSRLRVASCRTVAPVAWALAGGATHATFPRLPGWSVADVAARAVVEQRARLAALPDLDVHGLARAGRAAVLRLTEADGAPVVPVSVDATGALLDELRPGAGEALRALHEGHGGPSAVVRFRRDVEALLELSRAAG